MIHAPYLVPPLPANWPFQPRASLPPLACRVNSELPGFNGKWRRCTAGDVVLAGEPVPLSSAFGRGGILRVGDAVLRPYRRGGFIRHINERTYRSHLRFAAEFAIHRGLWEAGFPTVEPLGYAWRPCSLGVEGVLITRLTEGEAWPKRWDLSSARSADIHSGIAALCEWNLWSPDLNATNVLLPAAGGALFLDWDRARFLPPGGNLWLRYRERLERSLRKLNAPAEAFEAARGR